MKLNTNISTLKLALLLFTSAILFAATLAFLGSLLSEEKIIENEWIGNEIIETEEVDKTIWLSSYEEALALAKKENKPIFIDFTGWTCTNCRWMEENIFSSQEVQNKFKQIITVRLYTDKRSEPEKSNKRFEEERFNSIELPLYVLLSPNEDIIARITFTRDLYEFLNFLEKGTDYSSS